MQNDGIYFLQGLGAIRPCIFQKNITDLLKKQLIVIILIFLNHILLKTGGTRFKNASPNKVCL